MELNLINLFPLLSFLKDTFPTTLVIWGIILFFPSNRKNWKKKILVVFSLIGFDMWLSGGFLNKQLEKRFCSFYKVEQCELVKKVEDSLASNNSEQIKAATEALNKVWNEIASQLYSQAGPQPQSGPQTEPKTESSKKDEKENVQDASYEVVDDENKDK